MDKYNVDAILSNAGGVLESINGTQPWQEVLGYALSSIASSLFALAVLEAQRGEEPRGKHGFRADSQDGGEEG